LRTKCDGACEVRQLIKKKTIILCSKTVAGHIHRSDGPRLGHYYSVSSNWSVHIFQKCRSHLKIPGVQKGDTKQVAH
jgi:hypothetical protein